MIDIIKKLQAQGVKLVPKRIRELLTQPLRRHLFNTGNSKLTKKIISFGLPAVITCPGKTETCSGGTTPSCYATRGLFRMESVSRPKMENFVIGHREDFYKLLVQDLWFFNPDSIIRIHDAGDFFDAEYTDHWYKVCRKHKDRRFYFYTRSWRIKPIFKVLQKFNLLPNVRVWYSVDADTGKPQNVADNVRLCWFQKHEHDIPTFPVDLVFRDRQLRKKKKIREGGALICPVENGVKTKTKFDCFQCKICWRDLSVFDSRNMVEPQQRFSLPVIKS